MKKTATIKQVAQAAQVSMATASRVLNSNGHVDANLQKRVHEAAKALGFKQRWKDDSKGIAFLLCNRNLLHAFHSHILEGADSYCTARGWDVIFLSYRYSTHLPWKQLRLPRVLHRKDIVRGIIVAGIVSQSLLDLLTHNGTPFAVLGNNVLGSWQEQNYDSVFMENIQGAKEITQYLQTLGHRDIWYAGNCFLPWFARTYEGYRLAMEGAGLVPRHSSIESENEQEVGYLAAKSILGSGKPATAIFAGSDVVARGVYRAVQDCGLHIPNQLSVVGCNNTDGQLLHPPLTTIREFPNQVGKRMAELVLDRISLPDAPHQQITVPTQVIKRESCTAPGLPIGLVRKEASGNNHIPLEVDAGDSKSSIVRERDNR